MAQINEKQLAEWLGLTEQQIGIAKAMQRLEEARVATTPVNIEREYRRLHGRGIQKPNLFAQLRLLVEKGFVHRGENARYRLSLPDMRFELQRVKKTKEGELAEFQSALSNLDKIFGSLSRRTPPILLYNDEAEFYKELAKQISVAETFYCTSKFPATAFEAMMPGSRIRSDYYGILRERCESGELAIKYVSEFNPFNPARLALRLHPDRKMAVAAIHEMLAALEKQVKACPNLDIRCIDHIYGLDIAMPEIQKPEHFFIMIRDASHYTVGGIYVESPAISQDVKTVFMDLFKNSKRLYGPQTRSFLRGLEPKINEAIGSLVPHG
jgi:Fe2+ or Zn2+ uptake regulation protein